MSRLAGAALLALVLVVVPACDRQQQAAPDPTGSTRTWFVDNAAPGPAFTGDLASPFASLAAAEAASGPGDTIFLFAGDGTSAGYESGIVLKEGQHLIGEGVGLEAAGIAPGAEPVVTGGQGAAVILAGDNLVAGLRIEDSTAAGIAGSDVETLSLQAVTVAGAGGDGVRLEAAAGEVMTVVVTDLEIRGSGLTGLRLISRESSGANLELDASHFSGNLGNAVQIGYLGANGGRFSVTDTSVSTLGTSGVRIFSAGPVSQRVEGRIEGVTVTSTDPGTAGNGLAVIVEGDATLLVDVVDNTITRFGSFGIDIGSRGGSGVLEATVHGNTVSDAAVNALAGMRLSAGNGSAGEASVLCLDLSGNRSTEGSVPGYLQRQRPGSDYRLHGFEGRGASPAEVAGFLEASNSGSLVLSGADPASAPQFSSGSCRRPAL